MTIDIGMHRGDLEIDDERTVRGTISGNIVVTTTGRLTLKGVCGGDVLIEPGGTARIEGLVGGEIVHLTTAPSQQH